MSSLNDRFLPMFKNMRFETIVQIYHIIQFDFMMLILGIGINKKMAFFIVFFNLEYNHGYWISKNLGSPKQVVLLKNGC